MRKHFGQIAKWSGVLLVSASFPARAVDLVPFAGFRFGGDITATTTSITPPASNSYTVNSALSYGGVLDVPLWQERALEVYYSHEPTTISGGGTLTEPIRDVSVNVIHLGLVDSYPAAENDRLSWLLAGTFGATQLAAGGHTETRPSIGLGGGMVWMANPHVGLRADLRALITFTGNSSGAIACGGGCTFAFTSSVVVQGEVSLGLVARF